MIKICTSIEQSQKLMKLGLDANTADMCYHFPETNKFPICLAWMKVHKDEKEDSIPAWSLSALLDMLTEQDFIIKTIGNEFNIDIPIRRCKIWFSSLLDAAFEMICWLLKNGKI